MTPTTGPSTPSATTTPALTRRGVLGAGLATTATAALLGPTPAASAVPPAATSPVTSAVTSAAPRAASAARTDAEVWGVPTRNPLVERRADPFITKPVRGMYYFTGSVPEYDRLVVRGAPTLAGLATATESTIWTRPPTGQMGGHIWAPELHRIDGRWYVYFAAGDSDDVFRIRMYVMESVLADPRDPAGWGAPQQIVTPWQSFSLDATTFTHRGRRFLVWAQSEPEIAVNTSLYIAEMSSPFAISTFPARIATPTRSWEVQGFKVNEGPAVIKHDGRVFMTFSASATDARYCLGLLTADADADLLEPSSWHKSPEPVFTTNERTDQYGPGHNSFTVAEDGVTDVLVYHARDYRDITGDPLYDPNRHTRVQKLVWHEDGTPLFGVPVGKGGPVLRLSPVDAPRRFVRHDGTAVRADRAVRELGSSQFRAVAGLAGVGTQSWESVDQPGHYLRVRRGAVTLDPVEDAAAAAQASFRRVRTELGISLQVLSSSRWLKHDGRGQLTTGARPGRRSTSFTLS